MAVQKIEILIKETRLVLDAVKKNGKKMSTLFDFLPLDVINYEIKPYIENDYFARLALNALLPPIDRRGTPLRQDTARQLYLSLRIAPLKKLTHDASLAEGPVRKAEAIATLFDFLINNPLILQHNLSFRNTALRQATTFADPNCSQYISVQMTAVTPLICKAGLLLEIMEKTPFLYQLNTFQSNAKWTAVDGAGLRVVVDNSYLLAVALAKEKALALEAEKLRRSKPHWRVVNRRRGYYSRYYDDDEEDWEYGYFDKAHKWVCLEEEQKEEEQSPQRVSRKGTVLEADGWERVVSRKRR